MLFRVTVLDVRPLLVTSVGLWVPRDGRVTEERISGVIFCEPQDHGDGAFNVLGINTDDPATLYGRPTLINSQVLGVMLKEGSGVGQWIPRPANLQTNI